MASRRAYSTIAFLCLVASATHVATAAPAATPASAASIAHGKYLVQLGGCNDCHTAGYAQSDAKVPVEKWLLGDTLGFTGPWGTTYPANLRLTVKDMSEAQWIVYAHNLQARPPMPSYTLHQINEADLRDMYRFIKSLGAAGVPAPAFVPPGQPVKGPQVTWPGAKG